MSTVIRVAAALLIDARHRTLLVRKRGTHAFMQPGGKIEAGETARQALARELFEELGLHIDPDRVVALGVFTAPAANEPGCQVQAELFEVATTEPVHPAAEIEQVLWLSADDTPTVALAPLTAEQLLPLYRARLNGRR